MSDLNTAIQLVRQGNAAQAQKILEPIVRMEPTNVLAWLWYAQTWPSQEMRLKVLIACLKFNPGNEQVLQAVKLVRAKTSVQSNSPVEATASQAANQSSVRVPEKPIEILPISSQIPAEQPQPVESRATFEWDKCEQPSTPTAPVLAAEADFDEQPAAPERKAPRRSYRFYEVWWSALTVQNVGAYAELLDDPEAGAGRAIEWQIYTNFVIFSLRGLVEFFQPEDFLDRIDFQQILDIFPMLNSSNSRIVLLVTTIIQGVLFGVFGLLLNGAIQNFLARLFGGKGNFSRTAYALSAYLIPISIITAVMSYIPMVNWLYIGVIIYAFVLNVRAVQAAHGLNGGRATIIVAIPSSILLIAIGGIVLFLLVFAP